MSKFKWTDKVNGENGDDILAEDINSIAHEAERLEKDKADNDLLNVDDTVFKEKVESSGFVGGAKNLRDGEAESSLVGCDGGADSESASRSLGKGCVSLGEALVTGCMGYYIKSVDIVNKKVYLSEKQVTPTFSSDDNTDTSFTEPAYAVGDTFNIKSGSIYCSAGKIVAVSNNVITYEKNPFVVKEWETEDIEYTDHTLYVPTKPSVGIVPIVENSFNVGRLNNVAASDSFTAGKGNNLHGYLDIVLGGFNYAGDSCIVELGHGLYLVKPHQHGRGLYNVSDPKGEFADVFGIGYEYLDENGIKKIVRKNGWSLDWNGNMKFAGKVYADCENGTGAGYELAKTSLIGFNSPTVSGLTEDNTLYREARDSIKYEVMTDTDGVPYTHMIPQNTAAFMALVCYDLPKFPLTQGAIWVKFRMRTNQTVTPNVIVYNVKNESGTVIGSREAAVSAVGDGQWHEYIIKIDNFPEGAYSSNYIQIQFAGRLVRGSAYYDPNGNLKNNAYFDVSSWGIFTDEPSAECYSLAVKEHTTSLVGYIGESSEELRKYVDDVTSDFVTKKQHEIDMDTVHQSLSVTLRYYAESDLANVSNDVFKQKAIDSGLVDYIINQLNS